MTQRDPTRRCQICALPNTDTLAVRTVARKLSVTPMTIRREIHRGHLEAVRVGGCWRIYHDSLDAYLADHSSLGEWDEAPSPKKPQKTRHKSHTTNSGPGKMC